MFMMNAPKTLSETKTGIEIEALGKTDFFIDGSTTAARDNAPFYFEKREGDFVARVRVRPEFKKSYDAGGLFVYDSAAKWIKLEFEMTDLGYRSIVSVVTDKVSDDCNGERQDGKEAMWLQVARKGNNWTLHFSDDGKKWKMARYFHLKMKNEVKVGLEAQSPLGKGCRVEFTKYAVGANSLKSMRKGK
jgi:regulation of enolase protein 1 (concanavalin A-like superfamily)